MLIAQACVEDRGAEAAARHIASALGIAARGAPSWATVHHGAAMSADALQGALRAALGNGSRVALHGSSSCLGVMGNDGPCLGHGDGAGVFAVWDPEGDYGVGLAALAGDPQAAGAAAARAAMDDAGRAGDAPDLVWLSASPGTEEAVIAGVQDVLGQTTPIVGASAADNDVSGRWSVFDRGSVLSAGVVVSALYPSRPVVAAFQGGYAPSGKAGRVTRASGRRLVEIDNRPARAVYADWTGGAFVAAEGSDLSILAASSWTPLGRETESVAGVPFHLLVHPSAALADGSIELFAAVEDGDLLHQMHGSPDSLTTRAGRLARLVSEDDRLSGAVGGVLVVFCGGSMLAMRDRMGEVVAGLREALGTTPFLGIFSFGEQGPSLGGQNLHGNLMISCTAFGGT